MIQIIDVSTMVWFEQGREEKDLLSLINATVSHELRNPLNSIIAQNVRKESLYENMLIQLQFLDKQNDVTRRMKSIMEELDDGLEVQNSSCQMMSFLVQDFLDYAQIKSGKFR